MLSHSDYRKFQQIRDQYPTICTSQLLELSNVKKLINNYGDYAPAVRAYLRRL